MCQEILGGHACCESAAYLLRLCYEALLGAWAATTFPVMPTMMCSMVVKAMITPQAMSVMTPMSSVKISGRIGSALMTTFAGKTDRLQFTDVRSDQLCFRRPGSNLEISVIGYCDKVSIDDWFSGQTCRIEEIRAADDKALSHHHMDAWASATLHLLCQVPGKTPFQPNTKASCNRCLQTVGNTICFV